MNTPDTLPRQHFPEKLDPAEPENQISEIARAMEDLTLNIKNLKLGTENLSVSIDDLADTIRQKW